jgi:hypothetical protein
MEVLEDVIPPGVINVVTGPGASVGMALASSKRIAKIAFTGETVTGRLIMQYAAQNLIPSTTELGGKSPNIFFEDVMAADDAFLDKTIEGLVLYAFNKGEVCTCPSRALIQESIYDEFMERCLERIGQIRQGHPLDPATMLGPQVSTSQMEKIASYCAIGEQEGAELLIPGSEGRCVLRTGRPTVGRNFPPDWSRGLRFAGWRPQHVGVAGLLSPPAGAGPRTRRRTQSTRPSSCSRASARLTVATWQSARSAIVACARSSRPSGPAEFGRQYARARTTATNSSPRSVARRMKSLRPLSAISVISSTKCSA